MNDSVSYAIERNFLGFLWKQYLDLWLFKKQNKKTWYFKLKHGPNHCSNEDLTEVENIYNAYIFHGGSERIEVVKNQKTFLDHLKWDRR